MRAVIERNKSKNGSTLEKFYIKYTYFRFDPNIHVKGRTFSDVRDQNIITRHQLILRNQNCGFLSSIQILVHDCFCVYNFIYKKTVKRQYMVLNFYVFNRLDFVTITKVERLK